MTARCTTTARTARPRPAPAHPMPAATCTRPARHQPGHRGLPRSRENPARGRRPLRRTRCCPAGHASAEEARLFSAGSSRNSRPGSNACATPTTRTLDRALSRSWLFAIVFLTLCLGSLVLIPFLGQDFFPRSTPANSSCTSAPRPAPASRKPRGSATKSRRPSARKSPQRISRASSTTLACPTAASISPTPIPA